MAADGAADTGEEAVLCRDVFPEAADVWPDRADGCAGADPHEVGAGRRGAE